MKALLEMAVFSRQVGIYSVHYKLNSFWLPEHTSRNLQDIFRKYFHKCDFELCRKENFKPNTFTTLLKIPLNILINLNCLNVLFE